MVYEGIWSTYTVKMVVTDKRESKLSPNKPQWGTTLAFSRETGNRHVGISPSPTVHHRCVAWRLLITHLILPPSPDSCGTLHSDQRDRLEELGALAVWNLVSQYRLQADLLYGVCVN